jgi:hypothetical protein
VKKFLFIFIWTVFLGSTIVYAGWWRTFGGPETDKSACVKKTLDGGFIVSGVTWSFGDVGNANIWLVKIDSLGNKQWAYTPGIGGGPTYGLLQMEGTTAQGANLLEQIRTGKPYGQRIELVISDQRSMEVLSLKLRRMEFCLLNWMKTVTVYGRKIIEREMLEQVVETFNKQLTAVTS